MLSTQQSTQRPLLLKQLPRATTTFPLAGPCVNHESAEDLGTAAVAVQLPEEVKDFKETRCAQVNVPSDMPALHFVCQHPKHAQFLNDDREAAIYSAMSRPSSAMDGGADMGAVRQLEEAFYGQVDGAVRKRRDGFGTIAEYFGKGLFSNMQQQSQD